MRSLSGRSILQLRCLAGVSFTPSRWHTTAQQATLSVSAPAKEAPPNDVNQRPTTAAKAAREAEAAVMKRMHMAMQQDPGAVRLHRELLLCLANGDAEGSSDVAALLAKRIGNAIEKGHEQKGLPVQEKAPLSSDIPYSLSSLDDVTDKLSSTLSDSAAPVGSANPATLATPLTVTIIDSNFELEAASEEGTLAEEAKADEQDMKVLSQYLTTDEGAWKAQKRAVANALLAAAHSASITAEGLVQSDVAGNPSVAKHFNPFRECNVVVRCEVPPIAAGGDSSAARVIEEQLASMEGLPEWTPESAALARKELELGYTRMRYKVGLHYSLESSLGRERCAAFVTTAMKLLNEPSDDSAVTAALSIPAMPFTYMLRLCLWMEDPHASVAAINVGLGGADGGAQEN